MDVSSHGPLTAADEIVILATEDDRYALILGMYSNGQMTIASDREQLTRLRDTITETLDGKP